MSEDIRQAVDNAYDFYHRVTQNPVSKEEAVVVIAAWVSTATPDVAHSDGYSAGLEAAATFLDAQWMRGGVTQEETEALKRLAAGVRALPIKGRKP